MNEFGERLKFLRRQHGYTQKEVAHAMGMTFSAMSQYETGKRTPKNDILVKLANHYHVSVDYLLGLENRGHKHYPDEIITAGERIAAYDPEQGEEISSSDLSGSKTRVLAAINKLPEQKQMEILTAIELLIGTLSH